jgi:Protein of unknown function (DUF3309)
MLGTIIVILLFVLLAWILPGILPGKKSHRRHWDDYPCEGLGLLLFILMILILLSRI